MTASKDSPSSSSTTEPGQSPSTRSSGSPQDSSSYATVAELPKSSSLSTPKITHYLFREFYVPSGTLDAALRYLHEHIPPGDFLRAVICNDLKEAVARADDENLSNLPAIVAFFYNEAPTICWGSMQRMNDWLAAKG